MQHRLLSIVIWIRSDALLHYRTHPANSMSLNLVNLSTIPPLLRHPIAAHCGTPPQPSLNPLRSRREDFVQRCRRLSLASGALWAAQRAKSAFVGHFISERRSTIGFATYGGFRPADRRAEARIWPGLKADMHDLAGLLLQQGYCCRQFRTC